MQQLSGLWYHNRTHHPDIFAAQNHRSSKFSSLQCSSCDKTFSSTAAHRQHVQAEHTGNGECVSEQNHMVTAGRDVVITQIGQGCTSCSPANHRRFFVSCSSLVWKVSSQCLAAHLLLASPFPALSLKMVLMSLCMCDVAEVLTELWSRRSLVEDGGHTLLFLFLFTDVKFHECETCKELFPTLALLQVHVKCRHSGLLDLLLFVLIL